MYILLISCKNSTDRTTINDVKQKKDTIMKFDINEIRKHIELQKRAETEEEEFANPYNLTVKDLDLAAKVVLKELVLNGFKEVNESNFKERIKLIFKVDLEKRCDNYYSADNFITLFGAKMDGDLRTLLLNQYDLFYYNQNLFISNEHHFLLRMFLLEEIIKINDNNSFKISVPKEIIERNKYLFNDNKASYAWLKINDIDFLESLVKTFGYVADKDLLKFVLDKNLFDNGEFGKVFWTKDCDNKIEFHKETMDIIENLSKDKQEKYFEKIVDYFDYLLIDKLNQEAGEVDLTFSQKTEMLGKFAYYATKATGNQGDFYYRFFKFMNSQEFIKEFEKQGYYNIKDFKEIFEETKTGGVGLPM